MIQKLGTIHWRGDFPSQGTCEPWQPLANSPRTRGPVLGWSPPSREYQHIMYTRDVPNGWTPKIRRRKLQTSMMAHHFWGVLPFVFGRVIRKHRKHLPNSTGKACDLLIILATQDLLRPKIVSWILLSFKHPLALFVIGSPEILLSKTK